MAEQLVSVPDIGDFDAVDVVEVLVSVGDTVTEGQSLIVLESDKASMEVPSPVAGTVLALRVAVDDQVGEGDAICTVSVAAGAEAGPASDGGTDPHPEAGAEATWPGSREAPQAPGDGGAGAPARQQAPEPAAAKGGRADVVVLGAGPGGYTAAFRAADLGKRVVLVERDPELGGVCLNVGCIPSKALLHVAGALEESKALAEAGVHFAAPEIDFEALRAHKDAVVAKLTGGLRRMAEQRQVEVIRGVGRFTGPHELAVETADETRNVGFEHAIIAVGSEPMTLPGLPRDPRIVDSTAALEVTAPPGHLLVVGAGIIGLEMATVYLALGWQVSIVELADRMMLEADRDLVRPLERRLRPRLEDVWLESKVSDVEAREDGIWVRFEGEKAPESARFDRVLVAVGRRSNGREIGAERAGVHVDERGFVPVDDRQRSNVPHVFAIGDVTGPPQLAHRATHQGKTAAEVAAGLPSAFDPQSVPAVAYTDPEVAWTGLTEEAAREQGIAVQKSVFPWSASGRALGVGRSEGLTKLIFSEEDGRLLGAGIVGVHAGDLIAEAALAIELGADAEDLALTIHPHPTLSETVGMAAEVAHGSITDLLPSPRRS